MLGVGTHDTLSSKLSERLSQGNKEDSGRERQQCACVSQVHNEFTGDEDIDKS